MNKILLVTTSRSSHATRLEEELGLLDTETLRIDTDNNSRVWPNISSTGDSLTYQLKTQDKEYELNEFDAVWWDEVVPNEDSFKNLYYPEWAFLETQKAASWILSGLEIPYLNPPHLNLRASNKVLQLSRAQQLGILTPNTIISSNSEEVREFSEDIKTIYKPISRPTKRTVGDDSVILTSLINSSEINDDSIESKLSLLQHYVDKKYELRTFVIGDKCFSVEIHNQKSDRAKIDWRRYDIANTPHYTHNMPEEIQERLIKLNKSFGLSYSAMDLIVTPEEEYVFLEMNPQGLWLWLEKLTDLNISEYIAKELVNLAQHSESHISGLHPN